ncbi:MAG: histidine kinase [Akkermansiaceae bacterium]|nr:histidine kinase [Akkermansiaceae bacterium]
MCLKKFYPASHDLLRSPLWCLLAVFALWLTPVVGIGAAPAAGAEPLPELASLSLKQLEDRLRAIDDQLAQLPKVRMRGGVGSIGYESQLHATARQREWVQVDLAEPTRIDQIIVVPAIGHDSEHAYSAYSFPISFQIIAGTGEVSEGIVIASFDEASELNPRQAPLAVSCNTTASWVRLEVSVLSKRKYNDRLNVQFSELLVFNGSENVALNKKVSSSSVGKQDGLSRSNQYLTDGFMPYRMDSGSGPKANSFRYHGKPSDQPWISIDLGAAYPLDRIHLHAENMGNLAPAPVPEGYGFPGHFIIEGANDADFSDKVKLLEFRKQSIYDIGPVLMRALPNSAHRYVRLKVLEANQPGRFPHRVRFAEIEVFSKGKNVALGKTAEVGPLPAHTNNNKLLTDGCNAYGRIPPLRQWLEQLALRHELKRQRPALATELARRYDQQQAKLLYLGWIIALLATGLIITYLGGRLLRSRQLNRYRLRIAADLHDELGADLHTIGLLSDLSKQALHTPERLPALLDRIRLYSDRSAVSTRAVIYTLEAESANSDLAVTMERATGKLLADINYDFSVGGEKQQPRFSQQQMTDILLFHKECLINILRHAHATQVSIEMLFSHRGLTLTITDNGEGLKDKSEIVPRSIRRRARLLKARVRASKAETGGTRIILKVGIRWRPWHRWWPWHKHTDVPSPARPPAL